MSFGVITGGNSQLQLNDPRTASRQQLIDLAKRLNGIKVAPSTISRIGEAGPFLSLPTNSRPQAGNSGNLWRLFGVVTKRFQPKESATGRRSAALLVWDAQSGVCEASTTSANMFLIILTGAAFERWFSHLIPKVVVAIGPASASPEVSSLQQESNSNSNSSSLSAQPGLKIVINSPGDIVTLGLSENIVACGERVGRGNDASIVCDLLTNKDRAPACSKHILQAAKALKSDKLKEEGKKSSSSFTPEQLAARVEVSEKFMMAPQQHQKSSAVTSNEYRSSTLSRKECDKLMEKQQNSSANLLLSTTRGGGASSVAAKKQQAVLANNNSLRGYSVHPDFKAKDAAYQACTSAKPAMLSSSSSNQNQNQQQPQRRELITTNGNNMSGLSLHPDFIPSSSSSSSSSSSQQNRTYQKIQAEYQQQQQQISCQTPLRSLAATSASPLPAGGGASAASPRSGASPSVVMRLPESLSNNNNTNNNNSASRTRAATTASSLSVVSSQMMTTKQLKKISEEKISFKPTPKSAPSSSSSSSSGSTLSTLVAQRRDREEVAPISVPSNNNNNSSYNNDDDNVQQRMENEYKLRLEKQKLQQQQQKHLQLQQQQQQRQNQNQNQEKRPYSSSSSSSSSSAITYSLPTTSKPVFSAMPSASAAANALSTNRIKSTTSNSSKNASSSSSGSGLAASLGLSSDFRSNAKNATSVNADLAQHAQKEITNEKLKKIEYESLVHDALDNITEVQCKACFCANCNKFFFRKQDSCVKAGHHLSIRQTMKRFYRCAICKRGKLPALGESVPTETPCSFCRVSRWERISAVGGQDARGVRDDEKMNNNNNNSSKNNINHNGNNNNKSENEKMAQSAAAAAAKLAHRESDL